MSGPFSVWERAVAGRYLRARRKEGGVGLISIISFFGITLAVMVLIVVMSVMNGFRTELLSRILGFEGHAYVQDVGLSDQDRNATIQRLKNVPQVIEAMPVIESYALAGASQGMTPVTVRGIEAADLRATKLISDHINAGSLNGFAEGDDGGNLVVIGAKLAESMDLRPGDAIQLGAMSQEAALGMPNYSLKAYTVAATFQTGMSEYDSTGVLMSLAQAQQFFGRIGTVDAIELKLSDPDQATALKPVLIRAAGPGAVVQDWTDRHASYFNALKVEHITMRLILGMLVVIAAMNIISGLVMLVKNKGRDIAILRTMGASPSSILRIFFMTGSVIGVTGTLAGVTLGVLIGVYIREIQMFVEKVTGRDVFSADVYFLSYIPAKVDWSEVGWIALFSCLMAMLCTLPPAWRASRIDPVEALRYE
ncbi:MAG: ABC-type transport system, involved in lipoprotein release, permease component [Caulobacteraceae bacterium]|nr:ABC-type transport system, involved in lipoprotein release, permease component [Caulobacteraceae bacterium]